MPVSSSKTRKRTLLVVCSALIVVAIPIVILTFVLSQPPVLSNPHTDDLDYCIPIEWSGQDGTLSASATGTVSVGKPQRGKRAVRVDLAFHCDQEERPETVTLTDFDATFELMVEDGPKLQEVDAYYTLANSEGDQTAFHTGHSTNDSGEASWSSVKVWDFDNYEGKTEYHQGTVTIRAVVDNSYFSVEEGQLPKAIMQIAFFHVEHLDDGTSTSEVREQSQTGTTVYLTNPEDVA